LQDSGANCRSAGVTGLKFRSALGNSGIPRYSARNASKGDIELARKAGISSAERLSSASYKLFFGFAIGRIAILLLGRQQEGRRQALRCRCNSHTIHPMLLLLVAAQQQIPPINVIVQQPSGGMPEWLKILITAGTGALLGIISNIAMEFVKPGISKRLTLKALEEQLLSELKVNLNQVGASLRLILRAEEGTEDDEGAALSFIREILSLVSDDRYRFHFEGQKAMVYEIDAEKQLAAFYIEVGSARAYAHQLNVGMTRVFLRAAANRGREFLKNRGVEYEPAKSFYDGFVNVKPKTEEDSK
jgi:hypothetical protein